MKTHRDDARPHDGAAEPKPADLGAARDELRLLITLARADGTLDRAERSFVIAHALASGVSLGAVRKLLAEPATGQVALPPAERREALFEVLLRLAAEDGTLSTRERAFLARLGRAMQLPDVEARLSRLEAALPARRRPRRARTDDARGSGALGPLWIGLGALAMAALAGLAVAQRGDGEAPVALVLAAAGIAGALVLVTALSGARSRVIVEEVEATVRVVVPVETGGSVEHGEPPTWTHDEVHFTWRDSTGERGQGRRVVERGSMPKGHRFRMKVTRERPYEDDVPDL